MNHLRSRAVPGGAALLCLAALGPAVASAQSIRGIVIEALSRAPIEGAAICLQGGPEGAGTRATSDRLGLFVLTAPGPGLYSLRATHIGYQPRDGDTLRVGQGESVSIEIRLSASATPLAPLVVVARTGARMEGFEARRAGGFGRFLTRKDIEARAAPHTTDLLRAIPGVIITPQRRGPGSILQMRGPAGLCQPAIWIDGLFVSQLTAPTAPNGIDDLLPPSVIEAVEIYNTASSAPTQFRTGTCGVVLFWTRRGEPTDAGGLKWWKAAIGAGAAVAVLVLMR